MLFLFWVNVFVILSVQKKTVEGTLKLFNSELGGQ